MDEALRSRETKASRGTVSSRAPQASQSATCSAMRSQARSGSWPRSKAASSSQQGCGVRASVMERSLRLTQGKARKGADHFRKKESIDEAVRLLPHALEDAGLGDA